jgi:hypothetical protein
LLMMMDDIHSENIQWNNSVVVVFVVAVVVIGRCCDRRYEFLVVEPEWIQKVEVVVVEYRSLWMQ